MSKHCGLLGFISEAIEIKNELDLTIEEAFEIQRERADERLREHEAAKIESNIIQFRPRVPLA
jgi:hypothetical protein